jgi:ATP-dependent exoDNAse (exonuclease V) alpha subunit
MLSGREGGVELNGEFRKALNAMESSNRNIFVTGRAGTGKSTLLDYFRSVTRKNVVALAPTGVAALNIKGQTIHSFFHFKPDITPDTVKRAYNTAIYRALDMIIIDEISMVRADLLDCIDRFMRLSGRDAGLPFGGVQMVFIGDLYQLPPVVTRDEEEIFNGHYRSQYFFDSRAFGDISIEFIELKKHYRQKDARFIELLNAIRTNSATAEHINEINSRFDPGFMPKYNEEYITLTTTNRHSDAINSMQLSKILKPAHEYIATIGGEFNRDALPADERLTVKEGAQVMMLNNDKAHRWVNGTIGVIKEIEHQQNGGDVIVVRLIDGTYVSVEPHTWELFRMSYDNIAKKLVSGKKGSFVQYPLMLAWAVTIHKSQGKTFEKVVIDIGEGTFAHGQLYVALSRCTRLDGIVLKRRIEKSHILMDGRILSFLSRYNLSESDA